MPKASDLFEGTRFTVLRRLGAGGMGEVYEVHDRELDRRVAAKVLPRVEAAALVSFKREFRTLASIVHPNLVGLYELHSDEDRWFFTMDVVDGVDFLEWVRPDGLDPERLRDALGQLVRGVRAVHDMGRLHRDLKPSNVLVEPDGSVVILDFGLVTELGADLGADLGAGTIRYMAPEQWAGEELTEASDWYALGVMLYEALAGESPFSGRNAEVLMAKMTSESESPGSRLPGIPEDLDRLCADLMARDPERRPGGEEILERLRSDPPVAEARGEEASAPAEPPTAPLIGRAEHLAALGEALRTVERGVPTVVHVEGPSGMGKSLLVERFLAGLGERDDAPVVLSGRCFEQESVPYKAVDALIDALADHLERLPSATLEALVPADASILARLFPVLSRLEGFSTEVAPEVPDQLELRRRAFAALRRLLRRLAAKRPLILHIDDLQWGDVDSADLLADLVQPPDPPHLMLLLAYRSEYLDRSACLAVLRDAETTRDESVRRVDVPVVPLTREQSHDLAITLFGSRDPGSLALAERVASEAGGNPYFVVEFVRFLRTLPRDADTAAFGVLELEGILGFRVGQLPAAARSLLELVAVAGRPLRLRHAHRASEEPESLQPSVARLRAERLVRSTGPGLSDEIDTFHDRVRRAVIARLAPEATREHHHALALAMEEAPDADPETVGVHFEGAGMPGKARRFYGEAARQAARALAFEREADLYGRSIELHEPGDAAVRELRVDHANALANAGRGYEAAREFETAAGEHSGPRRDELERAAARQYCTSGHMTDGRRIFRRLLEQQGFRLHSNPWLNLATLLWRRFRLRLRGLDFEERPESEVPAEKLRRIDLLWSVAVGLSVPDAVGVASLQTEGLLLALDAGEPHRLARALAFEAFLAGAPAGWRHAERHQELLADARELAERIDDPYARGMVGLAAGMIALNQARFEDAISRSEAAEALFRTYCTGAWWEVAAVRIVIGWSHWHRGDYHRLRMRTAADLNEARKRGDLFTITSVGSVAEPHLSLAADDPDEAERQVNEAILAWGLEGFHLQHVSAIFTRAHIHMYRGDGPSALDHVTEQWPRLRKALQLQTQMVRIMMLDLRARTALEAADRATDPARFLKRAERDARAIQRQRTEWGNCFATVIRAGAAATRGRSARAEAHLRRAVDFLDEHGLALRAAAARVRLGELLQDPEGAELAREGREFMRSQEIVNVERTAALWAPGRYGERR